MGGSDLSDVQFTVLGAQGYIGSALAGYLAASGAEVMLCGRGDGIPEAPGHIIDCEGRTVDADIDPADTQSAHVDRVAEILAAGRYESFLYLSSTKIYLGSATTDEDEPVSPSSEDGGRYFEATKLAGEAACLALDSETVRVVRLANVYGDDPGSGTFLSTVIEQAIAGHIHLLSLPSSAKDYVALDDVVSVLPRISLEGRARRYNLASGINVTNRAICEELARVTDCSWGVAPGAAERIFPPIDIRRLSAEFGAPPRRVVDDIAGLVASRRGLGASDTSIEA